MRAMCGEQSVRGGGGVLCVAVVALARVVASSCDGAFVVVC